MANSRNYRTPTADDDADVPYWNDLLAQDVAQDVDKLEEAAPFLEEGKSGLLVAILDALRNRTWLEANDVDGGPSSHSLAMLRKADPRPDSMQDAAGLLVAILDAANNRTWLEANDVNGGPTAHSASLILEAIGGSAGGAAAAFLPTDTYIHRNGDVVPISHDMTKIAWWGSSTLDFGNGYFAGPFTSEGLTSFNGAKWGECATHIAARLGAIPALLTVTGGTVPASGAVTVTTPTMIPGSYIKPYAGKLAGIPGTLSSTDTTFTFTRTTAGTAVAVTPGTPFIPELGPLHRADVTVLNMGKNDLNLGATAATVIGLTDACHDWIGPLVKRVLVLGHFMNQGVSADNDQRPRQKEINAAHAARYGSRFVDIGAYITSPQVWTDTGITPTQADLDDQALGNKPPSLTPAGDPAHFNAAGYQAVAALVKARAVALGWI